MCTPGAGAMGTQAVGAATSAVGAFYEAKAQKTGFKTQAAFSDINARLSELTAQTAEHQGAQQEQSSRLQTAKIKSSQKSSMAANGISLGSDTAVNILTTTDLFGEVDANTISANAARSAWGYRTQALNYKNEALMSRASAKGINPWLAAGTSLMGSASSIAMSNYKLGKEGAFSSDTSNTTSNLSNAFSNFNAIVNYA